MKSTWRKHWIVCLCLGLLTVPIYFLDKALAAGGSGGWINLDFHGVILWSFIAWLGIDLVLSSVGVGLFPRSNMPLIHLGSIVLSLTVLVAGIFVSGQLRRQAISNEYQALMESRRPLVNILELKNWWYLSNETNPTEIDVNVIVRDSGRFAGHVTGEQTDESGSSTTIFESVNDPGGQRHVSKGESFTYAFPLKTLRPGHADNVRITLYLFKARTGPAGGDIAKVFLSSPSQADDGQYFYGTLPAPSRPAK